MSSLGRDAAGEKMGAIASIIAFFAVYAASFPILGVVLTLALAWLPAALAAWVAAHAVRFLGFRWVTWLAGRRTVHGSSRA